MKTKSHTKDKYNVITLGCSKNLVDSEVLVSQLKYNDFDVYHQSSTKDANIIIVNTCGFIDRAKEESINTILSYAKEKEKGKIDTVPLYLLSVFRPSVQPYMLSWMKYNPTIEIKKLQVPVLILQGTCDVQVKTTDANFLHEANKQATYLIIDGMTHTLKDARAGCDDKDMKTYKDPSLPLNNVLVTEIIKFVNDN